MLNEQERARDAADEAALPHPRKLPLGWYFGFFTLAFVLTDNATAETAFALTTDHDPILCGEFGATIGGTKPKAVSTIYAMSVSYVEGIESQDILTTVSKDAFLEIKPKGAAETRREPLAPYLATYQTSVSAGATAESTARSISRAPVYGINPTRGPIVIDHENDSGTVVKLLSQVNSGANIKGYLNCFGSIRTNVGYSYAAEVGEACSNTSASITKSMRGHVEMMRLLRTYSADSTLAILGA